MKINKLFNIKKGNSKSFDDYFDIIDANFETVAYVSAATNKNGINGFVSPKNDDLIFKPLTITVAAQGQGSVGYATVQPHKYIASTLVLILEPIAKEFENEGISFNVETLVIICALIRKYRWRFSFGRNIDPERIGNLDLNIDKIKLILSTN